MILWDGRLGGILLPMGVCLYVYVCIYICMYGGVSDCVWVCIYITEIGHFC